MIVVNVGTVWENKVGVNEEKYALPAIESVQDLLILHNGSEMVIPSDKVKDHLSEFRSGPYQDKYGGDDYHLVYYLWKPTAIQFGLFGEEE